MMKTAKLKQAKRRLTGGLIDESEKQIAGKRRTKQSGRNGDIHNESEDSRASCQTAQVALDAGSERETDAWSLASERPIQSGQGSDLSTATDSLRADPGCTNNGRCEGDTPSETAHHVADICQRLMNANRIRRNFVKSKVGLCNRLISSVAITMDFVMEDEESRTKAFKDSEAIISQVKKGKTPANSPEVMVRLITDSLNGIKGYDVAIKSMDKSMTKLAKQLPIADWCEHKNQRGFGLLSLALVIGECGDLSNYANPGKVWRRMGCAPFVSQGNSRMGSTWRRTKGLSSQEWEEYGYCPRRRSLAFVIGTNLLKLNGEPARETESTGAIDELADRSRETDVWSGPYRRRYAEVKAAKLAANSEEWPRARCHNHAMLLATKLLFKNLWIEWHKHIMSSEPVSEPSRSPEKTP